MKDYVSTERTTISEDDARRAHKVLQAVWVIVSSRHNDAVAQDVAAMGGRLRAAIDARDWTAAAVANEQVRTWLTTMAGVVTSRLTHSFSEPAG